jgi:hypothetical protein
MRKKAANSRPRSVTNPPARRNGGFMDGIPARGAKSKESKEANKGLGGFYEAVINFLVTTLWGNPLVF